MVRDKIRCVGSCVDFGHGWKVHGQREPSEEWQRNFGFVGGVTQARSLRSRHAVRVEAQVRNR